MKVDILGINIDDVNMKESLDIVQGWLNGKGKHYIVTPNPEIIMAAQKDEELKRILNKADLAIPDGVGLRLSGTVKNTVTGTDLMEKLVKLSAENGFTTGFLGGQKGVAEKCAECLVKKYPGLRVVFAGNGGEVDNQGNLNEKDLRFTIYDLRNDNLKSLFLNHKSLPKVDLLFVAFGHIKQEKWIDKNINKNSVKVIMTVGGAFDYFSGKVVRAPKWVRELGFEWLFRLLVQPSRIKRQLALVKYLWCLLFR